MSGFVPLNAGYTVSVVQNKAECVGPVDPGISKGVWLPTCILHEGAPPRNLAIEVSHAACKAEF